MYFSVVLTCLFQLGWMGSRKQSAQICGHQFAKTARASKGQSVSLFWEINFDIFRHGMSRIRSCLLAPPSTFSKMILDTC